MRIGTFVLGGLVGAAAVIYLSDKKNRSMMFSAMTSPTDSLGKVLSKTKDKSFDAMMNGAKTGGATSTSTAGSTAGAANTGSMAPNAATGSTYAGKDSMSQVEQIVNQDPSLKQTVNEILIDSGKTSAALQ